MDLYLEALAAELATLGQPQPVETLFIGGGTPTYLDVERLDRLLTIIQRWLRLAPAGEFSIESNPGTLTADKVAVLADHGVNRVSLGAQSFHPQLLEVLERDHDPAEVPRAVELVRRRIARLSLDLIFGVPGQRLEQWQGDLQQALALKPDHISTYGLTYEKGTRLWKQRRQELIQPLDEESELAMYTHAQDTLSAAGFEQYEISSFARPGGRCRHNQVYWANHAYFGFGMGAARYIEGRREVNTRDLKGYIRKALAGEPTAFQSEQLGPEERARETIAVQLRRVEGIERASFQEQTGFSLDLLAGPSIARHVGLGLLSDQGDCVQLTRQGQAVADTVIEELM